MQAFFCVCVGVPKGVSWSQALVAETVETGDKNRDVSQRHALFCEEKLLAGNSVSCRINRLLISYLMFFLFHFTPASISFKLKTGCLKYFLFSSSVYFYFLFSV